MPDLNSLLADLNDEQESLDQRLSQMSDADWDKPTPAEPWSVRDQISHLAFFDEAAALALNEPDAFNDVVASAATDIAGFMQGSLDRGRALSPVAVLGWWRDARRAAASAFASMDASRRVQWFGPPMSPASFVTARLMETWAHGQDIFDAFGEKRLPTPRLKHVAHLGVRARPFSYQARGRQMPDDDVRVELIGPAGELWTWGDSSTNRISGQAVDFCFIVTQRRHPDDTDLNIQGPAATEWMAIAQCFAGPPGSGRRPGQFTSRNTIGS